MIIKGPNTPDHWLLQGEVPCSGCGQKWTYRPPYADEEFSVERSLASPEAYDAEFDALFSRLEARGQKTDDMDNCEFDGFMYLNHAKGCTFLAMMNSNPSPN